MRGLDENSTTKKKSLMYHSTDGLYLATSLGTSKGVEFSVGGDELVEYSIELSREEAEELARFILRGL